MDFGTTEPRKKLSYKEDLKDLRRWCNENFYNDAYDFKTNARNIAVSIFTFVDFLIAKELHRINKEENNNGL